MPPTHRHRAGHDACGHFATRDPIAQSLSWETVMQPLKITPLRFMPSFEQIPEDEAQTRDELIETLRSIQQITARDYGHAVRSVHAKSHGLLIGEIEVLDGLPPELTGRVRHAGRTRRRDALFDQPRGYSRRQG